MGITLQVVPFFIPFFGLGEAVKPPVLNSHDRILPEPGFFPVDFLVFSMEENCGSNGFLKNEIYRKVLKTPMGFVDVFVCVLFYFG